MDFTIKKINRFILFKLPSAYLVGIRVRFLDVEKAVLKVTYKWINQNPFRSMYFGVQAMAAEISTGLLVMKHIQDSRHKFSMLVTSQEGSFTKKAVGTITFSCDEGKKIAAVLQKAIDTREPQTLSLQAKGVNEDQIVVSSFTFHWGIKAK